MKQQEKSLIARERILRSAMAIFSEKGYGNTSIKEIAAAAGYSIGLVYRYWPDKYHLYVEVWNEYVISYANESIRLAPAHPSTREMMEYLCDRSGAFASDPRTAKLYPTHDREIDSQSRAMMSVAVEKFQRKIADFILDKYPDAPERRIRTVTGVIHSILNVSAISNSTRRVPNYKFDREEIITVLIAIVDSCGG